MFPWKDAPFIDRNNGGSGVAWPETLSKLLAAIPDLETVIPGHIPPTGRADLQEFQRFTADLRSAVQGAKKAGQGVDGAAGAAMKVVEKYQGYRSDRVKAAAQALYDELP
jgi:hypothetical protein